MYLSVVFVCVVGLFKFMGLPAAGNVIRSIWVNPLGSRGFEFSIQLLGATTIFHPKGSVGVGRGTTKVLAGVSAAKMARDESHAKRIKE